LAITFIVGTCVSTFHFPFLSNIIEMGSFSQCALILLFINGIRGENYPQQLIVEGHVGPHMDCMGFYALDGTWAFGYPRYAQQGVHPENIHYMYRGGLNERWIIVLGEAAVAAKQLVLILFS